MGETMMSNSSNIESIFFAALGKETAADRADYLDHACGGDAELRRQVERLLEAHPQAVDFLAQPALDPHDFDLRLCGSGRNESWSDERLGRQPAGSRGGAGAIETLDQERGDDIESALSVLEPSERPGSLGRLAHYEVLEVLGKGGFGTVVKAFDEKLHRFVAIKLMSPLLAATSAARKRFLREARSAAAVRHENVVAIYAVEDQPIPYLVMEYVAGRTLQQKLDATGPLGVDGRAAHRPANRRRPGRGACDGLDSPRHQAGQHPAGRRRRARQDHRLRPGPRGRRRQHHASRDSSPARRCTWRPSRRGARRSTSGPTCSAWAASSTRCAAAGRHSGPRTRWPSSSASRKIRPARSGRSSRRSREWLCELISRLHAKDPADRIASAQDVADLLARRLAELQRPGNIPAVPDVPSRPTVKPPPFEEIRGPAPRGATADGSATAAGQPPRPCSCCFSEASASRKRPASPISTARSFACSPRRARWSSKLMTPESASRSTGPDVVITGAGVREIRLQPGRYTVEASKNGKLVRQELVNVTKKWPAGRAGQPGDAA